MDPESRRCTATSNATGNRCRRSAILGGTVCYVHGGRAPQVKAAAERRLAEAAVVRRLDEYGITPIGSPLEALSRLAEEAVALKDVLAQRVAALDDMRYRSDQGTEQLRAEVALYERAMDRAGRFLTDWVKLGFDDRMVRVHEVQAAALVAVIQALLADPELGLDDRQRQLAPALVARHVAALETASPT